MFPDYFLVYVAEISAADLYSEGAGAHSIHPGKNSCKDKDWDKERDNDKEKEQDGGKGVHWKKRSSRKKIQKSCLFWLILDDLDIFISGEEIKLF